MPHPLETRRLLVAGLVAVGLLLAGCTQTVSGHGAATNAATSPPNTDFPSSGTPSTTPHSSTPRPAPTHTSPAPASHLACPHVVDGPAHLGYDCLGSGMKRANNPMWPLDFERVVETEKTTTWTMDEGSGSVGRSGGTPAVVAKVLTQQMVSQFYGTPQPTSKTLRDADIAIGGARGHLVQTLITVNPTFRSKQHLRVKQEQLSLVVVPVGAGALSAWYVSVPDLQKQLWPNVPALLKTLHVV